MNVSSRQTNASLGWLAQAVSGIALLLLLTLHMVANHFVVPGGLQTYQDVIDYLANPLILVFEVLFLVFVTAHALLGVRAVIFDTGISTRARNRISTILAVLGVVTVAYGLWLTFVIVGRST
jgi:succinate dehydrogenase / fumarate reductase membrane anchor subunit